MQGNWGVPRRKNPGDAEAVRKGSSPEEEFEVDLEAWETVLEGRKVGYSVGRNSLHMAQGQGAQRGRAGQLNKGLYMCPCTCVCVCVCARVTFPSREISCGRLGITLTSLGEGETFLNWED